METKLNTLIKRKTEKRLAEKEKSPETTTQKTPETLVCKAEQRLRDLQPLTMIYF